MQREMLSWLCIGFDKYEMLIVKQEMMNVEAF